MFFYSNIKKILSDIIHTYDSKLRPAVGSTFQELYESFSSYRVLSLSICSDGISIFNSSNSSAWPILALVNELPSHAQFHNIFLMGIYYGSAKPKFELYFKHISTILKNLSSEGIMHAGNKYVIVPINVVADSVARCQLQNIKQFNGNFGCSWSKHQVTRVPKGNGFTQVYDFADIRLIARTHDGILADAQIAISINQPFQGVKGVCPLSDFPFFNLVDGFSVDLMHCIDIGVMKLMLNLWLNPSILTEQISLLIFRDFDLKLILR